MEPKRWYPQRTVVVQIANPAVETQIQEWSKTRDLDILFAKDWDLVAAGHLFSVVDERVVDPSVWSQFAEDAWEHGTVPSILINQSIQNFSALGSPVKFRLVPEPENTDWYKLLDSVLMKVKEKRKEEEYW